MVRSCFLLIVLYGIASICPCQNMSRDSTRCQGLKKIYSGDPDYEKILSSLFNSAAAASDPSVIYQPCAESDVQSALVEAFEKKLKINARGGGCSRWSAVSSHAMLDMSQLTSVVVSNGGSVVTVEAGNTMQMILNALKPFGRTIPVGTHPSPGFGLLLQGGIGYLSRSLGLTLDNIIELRGVRANGSAFVVSPSSDPEAYALLRGAAPFLAIVTSVKLRTFAMVTLHVARGLHKPTDLAVLIEEAERLPRNCSCTLALNATCADNFSVMTYCVAPLETDGMDAMDALPASFKQYRVNVTNPNHICTAECGTQGLPPFPNIPFTPSARFVSASPRKMRAGSSVFSVTLPKGLGSKIVFACKESMSTCPVPATCQIHFQPLGGRVGDASPTASAFTGRSAEWSVVITGLWEAGDQHMQKLVTAWTMNTYDALYNMATAYYIVERHPDYPYVYEKEISLAFGPILGRLRAFKQEWDSEGRLPLLSSGPLQVV